MSSFQLPTFPDLQDAPHLATLALLDAALAVVQDALCIQHPIDDPLRAPDPGDPHSLIAARLIVTRCLELQRLLAWYRRAIERDDDVGF